MIEQLISEDASLWLLAVFLKSFILVGITLLVTWILRSRKALLLQQIWIGTLILLLVLPILESVPLLKFYLTSNIDLPVNELPAYLELYDVSGTIENSNEQATVVSPNFEPEDQITHTSKVDWFFWLWLVGIVLLVLRWRVLSRIWRNQVAGSASVDPERFKMIESALAHLAVEQPVDINFSEKILSPVTFGIFKPVIILPTDAISWDRDLLYSVLHHELAHIKQNHALFNHILGWFLAFYWVNPLFWVAHKKIKLVMERTCDEKVIDQGINRHYYAQHLLQIAKTANLKLQKPNQPALGMARSSDLKERFQYMLTPKGTGKVPLLPLAILTLSGLILSATSIQPIPEMTQFTSHELSVYLKDNSVSVKQVTIREIVSRGLTENANDIAELLNHEDPEVRASAVWALGELKHTNAVNHLMTMVKDDSDKVKEMVLLSLAEFGYTKTFYKVKPLAQHRDPEVRKAALWSLSKIACIPAFNITCRALEDENREVRMLAKEIVHSWDRQKMKSWLLANLKNDLGGNLLRNSLAELDENDRMPLLVNHLNHNVDELYQQIEHTINSEVKNNKKLDYLTQLIER